MPHRSLEGDQARNARQGLVALVPDERQGRNKVGNSGSHVVSQISFHFPTKQYLEFGSERFLMRDSYANQTQNLVFMSNAALFRFCIGAQFNSLEAIQRFKWAPSIFFVL